MIKYKCASCGAKLQTDASLSGKHEACPVCRKVNAVPLSAADLAGERARQKAKQQEEKLREKRDQALRGAEAKASAAREEEMTTEERLDKLEKEYQRARGLNRRIVVGVGLGIVGSILVGALAVAWALHDRACREADAITKAAEIRAKSAVAIQDRQALAANIARLEAKQATRERARAAERAAREQASAEAFEQIGLPFMQQALGWPTPPASQPTREPNLATAHPARSVADKDRPISLAAAYEPGLRPGLGNVHVYVLWANGEVTRPLSILPRAGLPPGAVADEDRPISLAGAYEPGLQAGLGKVHVYVLWGNGKVTTPLSILPR
ncbi:MAG TPA: hypothetical protein VNA25_18110 [Phycisphaerae bacterium]|nr:hypothetical protein [Phycisphaerae bacterium]